jgi:hypothetical protein
MCALICFFSVSQPKVRTFAESWGTYQVFWLEFVLFTSTTLDPSDSVHHVSYKLALCTKFTAFVRNRCNLRSHAHISACLAQKWPESQGARRKRIFWHNLWFPRNPAKSREPPRTKKLLKLASPRNPAKPRETPRTDFWLFGAILKFMMATFTNHISSVRAVGDVWQNA